MSRLAPVARGLGALVLLAALVGGIPWALWHFIGWPLPHHVPNATQVGRAPLAGILLAVASVSQEQWWSLARAGIAMAAVGGFDLLLGLAFAGQFGIGDLELGGLLGLYLGWIGWSTLATGTLLGWMLGAMAIPVRRILTAGRGSSALPAGPFLVAGALIAVLAIR